MEILQIVPAFPPAFAYGGPAKVVFEISKELAKRGHQITVFTTDVYDLHSRYNNKCNPEYMDGIEVYRFKNISNKLAYNCMSCSPSIVLAAKEHMSKFDIVHIHEHRSFQAYIASRYAVKYKIPYVLQAHGSVLPFFQKQNLKKLFDIFLGNRVLNDASRVLALTNLECDQYKSMGINPSKIDLAPNGVDLREFDNLPKKGEFRKKYSIPINEKLILFLGRIHAIKGIDLLLDSFADLIKEFDNVTLALVGPDGGHLSYLEFKINKLNIKNKILITGPLYEKEKLKAFVDADVYVLSSLYETFPMTVLEAFACGTPVIITEYCQIADVVSDNSAALISKYNKDELKECISKVIFDEELKDRLSSSGKKLVKHTLNLDRSTDTICKIYSKALKNNKKF